MAISCHIVFDMSACLTILKNVAHIIETGLHVSQSIDRELRSRPYSGPAADRRARVLDSQVSGLRAPLWFQSATRWTQLTFTEDDPKSLDIDFWIDVMRRSSSNALCLSAGGYMAFYPTKLPYHHKSAYLGLEDPFGALVEAARGLGMHVMARVDPHAVRDDIALARPEWLARDADGEPIGHASMSGVWWTDPLSSYHREFITDVAKEITSSYDIDAIFANRWEGPEHLMNYGWASSEDFHAETGRQLPLETSRDGELWAMYRQWRSRRLSELVVHWDDAVREIKPNVRFIPNRGANLTRDLVRELVDDRYPMFFIDKQGRSDTEASWVPGRVAKRARGLYPDRPLALITSVGPEDNGRRWKDSVSSPEETISLIVDGFVHGARPWFTKFKAEVFDDRWVEPVCEAFTLHRVSQRYLSGLVYDQEVLMLDSQQPRKTQGHSTPRADHEDGFYHALVQARIPFAYISGEALSRERLRGCKVLVLPACPHLTTEQQTVIRDFVSSGGSVVGAYDSGLVIEDDHERLSLGDVFGVEMKKPSRGPLKNKYMSRELTHALTTGFEGASRIVAGTHEITVDPLPGAQVVWRMVPDYPDLPMEEVYPRGGEGPPAVVALEHASGGRSVYFSFDVGAIYWRALQADHGQLIAQAVRWACGPQGPDVSVSGAGLADIAAWRSPSRTDVPSDVEERAVAIVNLNTPGAMRGQIHELHPITEQLVGVRLPPGATGVSAHLAVADTPVDVTVKDGHALVEVDRVDHMEIVHLRWGPSHGGQPGGSTEGALL